jgi:hypothetical protein
MASFVDGAAEEARNPTTRGPPLAAARSRPRAAPRRRLRRAARSPPPRRDSAASARREEGASTRCLMRPSRQLARSVSSARRLRARGPAPRSPRAGGCPGRRATGPRTRALVDVGDAGAACIEDRAGEARQLPWNASRRASGRNASRKRCPGSGARAGGPAPRLRKPRSIDPARVALGLAQRLGAYSSIARGNPRPAGSLRRSSTGHAPSRPAAAWYGRWRRARPPRASGSAASATMRSTAPAPIPRHLGQGKQPPARLLAALRVDASRSRSWRAATRGCAPHASVEPPRCRCRNGPDRPPTSFSAKTGRSGRTACPRGSSAITGPVSCWKRRRKRRASSGSGRPGPSVGMRPRSTSRMNSCTVRSGNTLRRCAFSTVSSTSLNPPIGFVVIEIGAVDGEARDDLDQGATNAVHGEGRECGGRRRRCA